MNVNVNDISGFDAMTEEIRQVYIERDQLSVENEALRFALKKKKDAEEQAKQLTEDIFAALGICPDMCTKESILEEIRKLRREHDGSEYNLRKQEEFTEEAASILGVRPGDLSLSDILAALRKLKRCEKLNDMNASVIADLRGLNSDVITDLKDKLNKETDRRIKAEEYARTASSDNLEKICSELDIEYSTDTTIEYVLDAIEKLKGWKTAAADHDKRRKHWVRKYKSEHERANSCDELYKKYKALYDADAPKREKLSDDLQTYRSSYEAVKNVATKNRSLMNTVANIVGTVGMHDDVTMAGVQNAKKKANHWDVLVDGYGEETMRSLLKNIGIDVSGDEGNGLF